MVKPPYIISEHTRRMDMIRLPDIPIPAFFGFAA